MKTIVWATLLLLLALLWGGYPLCVALGLDDSVAILSNGLMPTLFDLWGALVTLLARALQCIIAPIGTVSALMWLALNRWL